MGSFGGYVYNDFFVVDLYYMVIFNCFICKCRCVRLKFYSFCDVYKVEFN